MAYASAVTTSCALAVGLTQSVPRLRIADTTKRILMKLVPFTAVATAGTVNVFLMRGKEITNGIDVYTEDNEKVGKSKKAGLAAVSQVNEKIIIIWMDAHCILLLGGHLSCANKRTCSCDSSSCIGSIKANRVCQGTT